MSVWALLLVLAVAPAFAEEPLSLVTTHVTVAGEVQRDLVLDVEGLRAIGQRRGVVEGRGYAGVKLSDVLDEADIRRDARQALRRTYVVAIARDGFQTVFSWGELFNTRIGEGVLVVFARDGAPLKDGEGRIALISLGDERSGTRHVKWLSRIEVRRVAER